MKPDLFDLIFLIGLTLTGVGLWLYSPAISLIVIGLFFMAFGFSGAKGGDQ